MAKILIVQDSKSIAAIMRSLLESHNFIVSIAETGDDAIKKVQAENFDLVLLDYGLPGMHGGQVCGFLKEDERFRHIPVIFMSAKRDDEMEKIVTESGAQGFIREDFDIETLIATVNGYLKNNQPGKSPVVIKIDKKQAAGKLGIPEELYNDIFKVFMEETEESIAKIDGFRMGKDFENLRAAAHSIKGSAGNLRIGEIHDIAKKIEYFDHEKDSLGVLDDCILQLKNSFALLRNNA